MPKKRTYVAKKNPAVPCAVCEDSKKRTNPMWKDRVCFPCYQFFRIYVVQKRDVKCKYSNNCDLTQERSRSNGNKCQKCRYEKCLQEGMEPEMFLNKSRSKKWVSKRNKYQNTPQSLDYKNKYSCSTGTVYLPQIPDAQTSAAGYHEADEFCYQETEELYNILEDLDTPHLLPEDVELSQLPQDQTLLVAETLPAQYPHPSYKNGPNLPPVFTYTQHDQPSPADDCQIDQSSTATHGPQIAPPTIENVQTSQGTFVTPDLQNTNSPENTHPYHPPQSVQHLQVRCLPQVEIGQPSNAHYPEVDQPFFVHNVQSTTAYDAQPSEIEEESELISILRQARQTLYPEFFDYSLY